MPPGVVSHPMELLLRRLACHAPLTAADRQGALQLPWHLRTLEAGAYVIREGEPPQNCGILLDGFVIRQKLTSEGDRQIAALHIPGDPLDFHMLFLDAADHNVQALTRVTLAVVPRAAVQQLIAERPMLGHAVIVSVLVDASIGREWLLNIGRRNARARLAHLLCEFACRMDAQGLAGPAGYDLPMTQEQLGDALGLTGVHVNRTLKVLEAEGLIQRRGRHIVFQDWQRIRDIADFSELYLHLHENGRPSCARERTGA